MKYAGPPARRKPHRTYRLGARAVAAEATGVRIVEAFIGALASRPYVDISLDEIAEAAAVTRQTVIRRFENKAGLLGVAAREVGRRVEATRAVGEVTSPGEAVARLVADYERTGAFVINCLRQEHTPELHAVLEIGRAGHRTWVERAFGRHFAACPADVRDMRQMQIGLVTDVWMWHVLRNEQRHTVDDTVRIIEGIIRALLPVSPAPARRGRGT